MTVGNDSVASILESVNPDSGLFSPPSALDPVETGSIGSLPIGLEQEDAVVGGSLVPLEETVLNESTLLADSQDAIVGQNGDIDPITGAASPTTLGGRELIGGYIETDSSGEIDVEYLFDSGQFSEMRVGVFSLEGMDDYSSDWNAFKQEAARRIESDSVLGVEILNDNEDAAKFDSPVGWIRRYNTGENQGQESFQLMADAEYGILVLRRNSWSDVIANPGGSASWMSLELEGNPELFDSKQIADITGDGTLLGIEDIPLGSGGDRDYDDILFQITGANFVGHTGDELIAPDAEWRNGELGQEMIDYALEQIADKEPPATTLGGKDLIGGYIETDSSGEIDVEYLFDSGQFSEMRVGVFSLEGMDDYSSDWNVFKQEAARRIESNSLLGVEILNDNEDAAKFDSPVGWIRRYNTGENQGQESFQLMPDAEYGIFVLRRNSWSDVIANPGRSAWWMSLELEGTPELFDSQQIADITGDGTLLGIEDIPLGSGGDRDYDDILFQITGANFVGHTGDELIAPDAEWRNGELGQEMIDYALEQIADKEAPVIQAALANDTGSSSSDGLTNDVTITGTLTDESTVVSLRAGFADAAVEEYVEIIDSVDTAGNFSLHQAALEEILGHGLTDGFYELNLIATDSEDNSSLATTVSFRYDRNISKVTLENTPLTFSVEDFTEQFSHINITSLPTDGTLTFNGNPVTVNQQINVTDLGNLSFTPTANFVGNTSFTWNASDGNGYATTDATVNITVNLNHDKAGNTLATARNLGTYAQTRPFKDFVGTADTDDYYSVNLATESHVRLQLDGLSANADIQLLDSSGNHVLFASSNPGTSADIIASRLAAGDYYILVNGNTDTNYELTVSVQNITGPAYYVSADGNDRNAGTFDQPFQTIQKAASLATAGETVYIRGGTYREHVTPKNSGSAGNPITFTSFANEDVTVSGTEVISGWTQHSGNIYKSSMNWDLGTGNNQIFVNGEMMVEARWPNIPGNPASLTRADHAIAETGTVNNSDRGIYTDDEFNFADNFWQGAKINSFSGWNWTPKTGTVVNHSGNEIVFDFPWNGQEQYKPQNQNAYYLWDTIKALDSAKEWYYDDATSDLYLWSPNGDAPTNYTVEAKQREFAFELLEKSYINLENIDVFGAAVKVWQSDNVTLDGIESQYGAHGQLFDDTNQVWENQPPSIRVAHSDRVTIQNSHISNTGGVGVNLFNVSNNKVTNSVIQNIGYAGTNAAAVSFTGDQVEISNNTFYNSGARLINVNGTNSKVTNNELYNGGLQASDFGGIIAFRLDGQGTEISQNVVHDLNAIYDPKLKYYGSAGILLEDSHNLVVDSNVVYNTSIEGIKLYDIDTNSPNAVSIQVSNNTVDGEILVRHKRNSGNLAGTIIRDNILSQFSRNNLLDEGIQIDNNFEFGDNNGLFVDASNHNYQLQAGTEAIGKGALVFGQQPWTAGSILSEQDLYDLQVQVTTQENGLISGELTGLAPNKKLPENFKLIIGNSTASGTFASSYIDPNTNLSTVVFNDVAVGSLTGTQRVYIQIGNNPPLDIDRTIELS